MAPLTRRPSPVVLQAGASGGALCAQFAVAMPTGRGLRLGLEIPVAGVCPRRVCLRASINVAAGGAADRRSEGD